MSNEEAEAKAMQAKYKDYPIAILIMRNGRPTPVCSACLTQVEIDSTGERTKRSSCSNCGVSWWDAETADYWIENGGSLPPGLVTAGGWLLGSGISITVFIAIIIQVVKNLGGNKTRQDERY